MLNFGSKPQHHTNCFSQYLALLLFQRAAGAPKGLLQGAMFGEHPPHFRQWNQLLT